MTRSPGASLRDLPSLIYLVGRDCGLNAGENEELVQLVMCEIFRKDILAKYNIEEVPKDITFKYDPSRGRFRYFLKAIIRNQALKLYHKRGDFVNIDEISEPVAEAKFDSDWDEEWRRHLFTQAMESSRTRSKQATYSAFEMYAVQERPVKDVADFLNLSVNSVYVAKNRLHCCAQGDYIRLGEEMKHYTPKRSWSCTVMVRCPCLAELPVRPI